jgi:hypothetical protein
MPRENADVSRPTRIAIDLQHMAPPLLYRAPLMKPFLKPTIVAFALTFSAVANALTINPATTAPIAIGDDNSNLSPSQLLLAEPILVGPLTLLYKSEVGGSDSGTFAATYNTVFSDTPTDPSGATISYVSGPVPGANPLYLYVKDGNAQPAYYVFDVSGWNGSDPIVLVNFWPQQGAISNLQLLGGSTAAVPPPRGGPGVGVPDGGTTVALLGAALALLGLAYRRFQS